MLHHVHDVLNTVQLVQVQAVLHEADWSSANRTAGTQSAQVKNNYQLDEDSAAVRQLQPLILGALASNAHFLSAALPKRIYPPLFNRYEGEHNTFGNHIDNAVRTHPKTNQNVRTDVSATLFLSDPASYTNGELVIEHSFGQECIKLAAGDMLLYSGSSVHRVEPVTNGARVACFFWVESMVRCDQQRTLLFQMDQAITALRAQHGDNAQTVSLTGSYHNLLRMWADV